MSSPIRSSTFATSPLDAQASPGVISCTVPSTVRWAGMCRRPGPRKPIGPRAAVSAIRPISAPHGSWTASQSKTRLLKLRRGRTEPTWSRGRPLSAFIACSVSRSGFAASAQKLPKA